MVALEPLDELPAAHHGHHEVDQKDGGQRPLLQDLQRLRAVVRARGRKTLAAEKTLQRIADARIVIDDQYCVLFHAHPPSIDCTKR